MYLWIIGLRINSVTLTKEPSGQCSNALLKGEDKIGGYSDVMAATNR